MVIMELVAIITIRTIISQEWILDIHRVILLNIISKYNTIGTEMVALITLTLVIKVALPNGIEMGLEVGG